MVHRPMDAISTCSLRRQALHQLGQAPRFSMSGPEIHHATRTVRGSFLLAGKHRRRYDRSRWVSKTLTNCQINRPPREDLGSVLA